MIVTCALDNRKSFVNLKNWLFSIKENNSNNNLPIIICVNKCDLEETREIRQDEIQCLAKEWNADFFETSAKDGTKVDEAFDYIIHKIYNTVYKKTEGFKIDESTLKDKEVKCC
jgi:small GTP-binding protein